MSSNDIKNKKNGKGGFLSVFCRIIGIFLIVVVICFGLLSVVPRLFGAGTYNILSGSMEPEIPVGSMIFVKKVEPSTIKVGDVIVYERQAESGSFDSEEQIIAHRVTDIYTFEQEFTTKGDANPTEDIIPVKFHEVQGIVSFHVPMLGQFMTIYTTLPGKICMIGVVLLGVLLIVLSGRLKK